MLTCLLVMDGSSCGEFRSASGTLGSGPQTSVTAVGNPEIPTSGIIAAFPLIRSAFKSLRDSSKRRGKAGGVSDEMPVKLLYAGVVGGALTLIVVAYLSVEGMSLPRAEP